MLQVPIRWRAAEHHPVICIDAARSIIISLMQEGGDVGNELLALPEKALSTAICRKCQPLASQRLHVCLVYGSEGSEARNGSSVMVHAFTR